MTARNNPRLALLGLACLFVFGWLGGCSDDDPPPCGNGTCVCVAGAECNIPCAAPPCHIDCQGNNPSCVGQCANGDCRCGPGSHCDLGCAAPPCHVTCEANSRCNGVCANGTCECATGSSCTFACPAGPCHVECAGDNARCDGECSNGSCECGPNSSCHFSCLDGDCSANCAQGSSCVLECPRGRAGEQGCRFEGCASGTPVVCPGGMATACNAPCPSD